MIFVLNLADADEFAFESSHGLGKASEDFDGASTVCPDDTCSSVGSPCSQEPPSPAPVHRALPPSQRVPGNVQASPVASRLLARRRLAQKLAEEKVTPCLTVDVVNLKEKQEVSCGASAMQSAKHGFGQCFAGIRELLM